MILCDKEIKKRAKDIFLSGYDEENVHCISYDLTPVEEVTIRPKKFVWIACREKICVPNDLAVRVLPRNIALRVGLRVEAPLYFPGHETQIYLRVENLTKKTMHIGGYVAQLVFEKLSETPEKCYHGKYQGEGL